MPFPDYVTQAVQVLLRDSRVQRFDALFLAGSHRHGDVM